MRVLVCGGRKFSDRGKLFYVLDQIHGEDNVIRCIIEGEAQGADLLAASWASARGVELAPFPADWKKHGWSAGPIRNRQMLIEGKPDLVVGFPGGTGTLDMLRQAVEKGVQTIGVDGWIDIRTLKPPGSAR